MSKGTRTMAIIGVAILGAFALFMCVGAFAATQQDVDVSASVASTLQLNMPTTTVDFGGGPLESGQTYTQAISASVNSNRGWSLRVTKDHDLQGVTESIPSSALTFGATSGDVRVTFKAPAGTTFGTGTLVVQGTRGSGISSSIGYSLSVPWDQEPDTYTATHTYTATQP